MCKGHETRKSPKAGRGRPFDYAVLSAHVAHKLERNDEIERRARSRRHPSARGGSAAAAAQPAHTINMTLDLTARIFKDAVKRGLLQGNPASDRDLRLKVMRRKGNLLEADELLALIEAVSGIDEPVSKEALAPAELARRMRRNNRTWKEIAGELDVADTTAIWLAGRYRKDGHASPRRAILATLGCAGLRNSEVCDLNLGDLDFAHGVIHVRDAKDGGRRPPGQRDPLAARRAARLPRQPSRGAARRARVSQRGPGPVATGATPTARVIARAVRAANALRVERREQLLPGSLTAHTFRRTFITLMLEASAPVPYVQAQVGHEDPTTTLAVYAQVLKRPRPLAPRRSIRRADCRPHRPSFAVILTDWKAEPSSTCRPIPTDPATEAS